MTESKSWEKKIPAPKLNDLTHLIARADTRKNKSPFLVAGRVSSA